MRFGICGYGNLGKAVEKQILRHDGDQIVGIFSRRDNLVSENGSPMFKFDLAKEFEGSIDAMLMCGGSQEDLLWQSPQMLKYFDIVDTFDTHAKIKEHKLNLLEVAKHSRHRAIYSCGWDPGLFSIARTLGGNIFDRDCQTFWGMGVSQGHSEALRNIPGVLDAIQFTIPNRQMLEAVKSDPTFVPKENKKHERHCYICLDGSRREKDVVEQIKNTENYFKGQKVNVVVCDYDEIQNLKKKMYHQGIVIDGDGESRMDFSVSMDRNPDFTAKIVVAYARALPNLAPGAYSVLDVPVGLIGAKENELYL